MTAGDIPIGDFSYLASTALAAQVTAGTVTQYCAVMLNGTSNQVAVATTGLSAIGILQDNPTTALKVCSVREFGHSKARMYSSGSAGAALKVADSYGRLGTGTATTDIIIAYALEAWTATDQVIEVAMTSHAYAATTYRAGHIVFDIPILNLRTTGNIYASVPLGFSGTVTNMFAVVNSACTATTSATAAIDLLMGAAGATQMTGLTIPVGNLTAAACNSFGSVIAGSGTPAVNTFVPTDLLTIHVTQGSTRFGAADPGTIELHIVTN